MMPNQPGGRGWAFWLCWLAMLASGCAGARKGVEGEKDAAGRTLTAEEAKRALLRMEAGQIPAGVMVPLPQDDAIDAVGPDEVAMGLWKCHLKELTFHATALFPDAPRHRFNHVGGVFERAPDGEWVARITSSESGG